MEKYTEYDTVVSLKTMKNIPVGSEGVILIPNKTSVYYFVEFLDQNNDTVDAVQVHEDDIKLVKQFVG